MTSKTLLQRLQAIRQDIDVMPKDGHNDFNRYDYLSEAQVTLKMKELMDKHGVIFVQSNRIIGVREQGQTKSGNSNFMTTVKVLYKFVNVDDPTDELRGFGYGQGTDTGDKGVYKAITGAIKYIFMKNFLIPTGDDAEKHSPTSMAKTPTDKDNEFKDSKCQKCGAPIAISQQGKPYCSAKCWLKEVPDKVYENN